MKKQSDSKRKGMIGTVVFHLVLLIIFLFTGLTMPVPLPDEKGLPVQLDLGNVDFGSGDEQPQSTEVPEVTEPISEPQPTEANPVEAVEEVATQTDASAISAPKETEAKKVEEKKPELDERLKKAISNPFQTNEDNSSKGQGETNEPGDHGKPDGAPTGSSLYGDKSGGGISHSLGGRGFKGAPPIQGNMQESGKIVVEIVVDRDGNVVRVTPGGRGTTITNAELIRKVVESARKAKFTPKADAPAEQKGTITYEFSLE
ncbi:MAG: TonB family protein [Flavobacteriales bacterium]